MFPLLHPMLPRVSIRSVFNETDIKCCDSCNLNFDREIYQLRQKDNQQLNVVAETFPDQPFLISYSNELHTRFVVVYELGGRKNL